MNKTSVSAVWAVLLMQPALALSACSGGTEAPEQQQRGTVVATSAPNGPPPPSVPAGKVAGLLAKADPAAGKQLFEARCAVCHSLIPGQGATIGPHLAGVVGRTVAGQAGFAYSPALKKHGGAWNPPALDAFLAQPQMAAPGTMMAFPGLPQATDRANLIAYLQGAGGK
jgi:cytochrome c